MQSERGKTAYNVLTGAVCRLNLRSHHHKVYIVSVSGPSTSLSVFANPECGSAKQKTKLIKLFQPLLCAHESIQCMSVVFFSPHWRSQVIWAWTAEEDGWMNGRDSELSSVEFLLCSQVVDDDDGLINPSGPLSLSLSLLAALVDLDWVERLSGLRPRKQRRLLSPPKGKIVPWATTGGMRWKTFNICRVDRVDRTSVRHKQSNHLQTSK